MEKFYTTKELCELFGVSRYSIHRAKQSGRLPAAKTEDGKPMKQGVEILYAEADVMRYIEESGKLKETQ